MAVGYITVALNWSGAGSPGTNTWSLRTTGSGLGGAGEAEGLAGIVKEFYESVASMIHSSVVASWDGVVHGLGEDQGDTVAYEGWEVAGAYNAEAAARAICLVANWRANTGGRKGKGRTFLGPLGAAAITTAGVLAPSFITNLDAACSDLIESSDSFANGALGVYSRVDSLFRDYVAGSSSRQYGVLRSRRD